MTEISQASEQGEGKSSRFKARSGTKRRPGQNEDRDAVGAAGTEKGKTAGDRRGCLKVVSHDGDEQRRGGGVGGTVVGSITEVRGQQSG